MKPPACPPWMDPDQSTEIQTYPEPSAAIWSFKNRAVFAGSRYTLAAVPHIPTYSRSYHVSANITKYQIFSNRIFPDGAI